MFLGSELAFAQVLRDTNYRTADPGELFSQEEQEQWQALALDFFKKLDSESQVATGATKRKLERVAAFMWCRASDWMLQVCTGVGFKRFAKVASDPVPIQDRPCISLALDKGSDGFSSVWALLYKWELRVCPFFDPFHIPWRDLDRFMEGEAIKTSMILKSVSHNLEFGPWDGESWAQQLRDTAKEVSALGDTNDPVLNFWWPKIVKEFEWPGDEAESTQTKAWFLKELPDFWWLKRKGPRVCTSRWGTFCEAEQYRESFFAQRCFVLMWQGLAQGWLTKKSMASFASELTPVTVGSSSSAAPAKQTTKGSKTEVSRLRDRAKNSAQLSLFVMMDSKVSRDVGILTYCTKPVRLAQNLLAARLKSLPEVRAYYKAMACRDDFFIREVDSLLRPFANFEDLAKVGFNIDIDVTLVEELSNDHVLVMEERLLAPLFVQSILSALGKLMMGHFAGPLTYPGRFAALLSEDGNLNEEALQEIKVDYEAWQAVKNMRGAFWTRFMKRTCFNWTIVQETFELLVKCEFKAAPEVAKQCRRLFNFIGSTYPVECCFQKCTDHSDRDNANKRISGSALWHHPVSERMLERVFHFDQVDENTVSDAALEGVSSDAIPNRLFTAKNQDMSIDFKKVVGVGPPSWTTFSGKSYGVLVYDHMMVTALHRRGCLHLANEAWRSGCLPAGSLVSYESNDYFVIHTWEAIALLWKAVPFDHGELRFWDFAPFDPDVFRFEPIVSFEKLQVYSIEWGSPLLVCLALKQLPVSWAGCGLALQKRGPEPFMQAAAKAAFWNLHPGFIRRLARAEKKMTLSGDDVEQLYNLIKAVLGCTDLAAAQALELRCSSSVGDEDMYNGMLMTAEVDQQMSRADWEATEKCHQRHEETLNFEKATQCKIYQTIKKHAKKKKKFAGSGVPFPSLPDELEPDKVLELLPEACKLRLDTFNGRWHCFFKCPDTDAIKALSRSWGMRGHEACILEIVEWSWGLAIGYGMHCPYSDVCSAVTTSAGSTGAAEGGPRKKAAKRAA